MKIHKPNPALWSKILENKGFEQQLHKNIKDLPVLEPNAEIWGAIEQKLDKPKKAIIWYYLGAAAIALLLLFTGLDYFIPSQNTERPLLITENPKTHAPDKYPEQVAIDTVQKTADKRVVKTATSSQVKNTSQSKRETIKPISAEPIAMPPLNLNTAITLSKVNAQRPMVAYKKTYHEVKISWSAEEPASQLSLFGTKEKVQEVTTNYSKASIQVKLIKPKN
ncbi:hypothetical protein [Cyclobacterium qasimii]|uniref:Uncharacterized protein n=1 Tax=Cyclobacterium qasimii TaxID=1350429 RepID=A0A512C941_9BACT|nr:hypothetical protein [Cyclobacterium qasimii]GEO20721.1 hypothetical protein CQA01_12550 [Cyclobacterium qasimii]